MECFEVNLAKCYALLELEEHASLAEIRRGYRDLVAVWHPDRFDKNQRLRHKAEGKLKLLNLAYRQIINSRDAQMALFDEQGRPDKRRFLRQPCQIELKFSRQERFYPVYFAAITNISGNGVLVSTKACFEIGQRLLLNFYLPRFGKIMDLKAEVKRREIEAIGVQFRIKANFQRFLARFVENPLQMQKRQRMLRLPK